MENNATMMTARWSPRRAARDGPDDASGVLAAGVTARGSG